MYAHQDVAIQQSKLEEPLFAAQVCVCVCMLCGECIGFVVVLHVSLKAIAKPSLRVPMICKKKGPLD